jgi:ribosome-associated heat shock protein Hsp15
MDGDGRQRIDKWLWFARLARTRTAAQRLVAAGRVRVNGDKTGSASRMVKIGDVLTVGLESGVRVLRIAAAGIRRGPAPEARLLYEDLSPPPAPGPRPMSALPVGREPGQGRPTKRDRRQLASFRGLAGEDFPPGEE